MSIKVRCGQKTGLNRVPDFLAISFLFHFPLGQQKNLRKIEFFNQRFPPVLPQNFFVSILHCLLLSFFLSLSLFLYHTHSLSHSWTHWWDTLSLLFSLSLLLSLILSHTHTLSLVYTIWWHTLFLSFSLALSLSHTHALSLSLSLSPSCSFVAATNLSFFRFPSAAAIQFFDTHEKLSSWFDNTLVPRICPRLETDSAKKITSVNYVTFLSIAC